MNYMDTLSHRNSHTVSPSAGSGSALRATAHANGVSVSRPWAAELAEYEHAVRSREMRAIGFGARRLTAASSTGCQ